MTTKIMTSDRVRHHTDEHVNQRLDEKTRSTVEAYAGKDGFALTNRIAELEGEWDIERCLETNASLFAMTGLVLGLTVNKKWLLMPGVVLPFLFQHAVQGWCPPLPVLRRLGIRTREEIDQEKYALKALRGDFAQVSRTDGDAAYDATRG